MPTEIRIDQAGHVSAIWTGPQGGGSLMQMMASSNCEIINQLTKDQIVAVLLAVRSCPSPVGRAAVVYRKCLSVVSPSTMNPQGNAMPIGLLRAHVVRRAGCGCNAPVDTYLKTAIEVLSQ